MNMIVSSLPIWAVDVVGSVCMILLSISCLYIAGKLHHRDRNNIIWTYLFWVCTALTVFAVSRSAGHILKQILIIGDNAAAWESIRPYSGAVNTFTFVVVASFTLFFERTWNIYQQITSDKQDLQTARDKLLYLNQNLENLVSERTAELALSEHKYRRIFEVSRDLILVAGKDGRIVDINPSGSVMLRVDDAEAQGRYLQNFFLELSEWQSIVDTIEARGFVANAEIDLKRSDGRRIRTLLSGSLDRGFPDKEDTIHFLIKDIEQRRLAEEQIAQADKLASIGQLSAGIAHEINNPLGIILGFTQLLIRPQNIDLVKRNTTANAGETEQTNLPYKEAKEKTLVRFNQKYLSRLLSENRGNVSRAARQCGLERQALQQIMRRYDIWASQYRA
jgi:PAS domain S-box-containing protein